MEAKVLHHTDRVFCDLDSRSGQWILTHTTTGEAVALEGPGPYELAWDEGFAFLVEVEQPGDEAEVDVDTLFSWQVCECQGREVTVGPQSADGASKYFIDTAMLAFERKKVWLRIGATRAKHEVPCIAFERCRSGFRLCWSLVGLYKCLGFSMFNGVASQWAYKSVASIGKVLGKVSSGLLYRSQEYASVANDIAPTDLCLPFHAMATLGLVLMLCIWCGATARRGGLRSATHREAARSALVALVELSCNGKPSTIPLLVDTSFEWRAPRPPAGEHPFDLGLEDRFGGPIVPERVEPKLR